MLQCLTEYGGAFLSVLVSVSYDMNIAFLGERAKTHPSHGSF